MAINLDEITEERRKAISATIHPLSHAEVAALGEKIFSYHDDPWREQFFAFLAAHPLATFHHASASSELQVLYCSTADRGIWFIPGKSMGILQERGLKIMSEIVGGAI